MGKIHLVFKQIFGALFQWAYLIFCEITFKTMNCLVRYKGRNLQAYLPYLYLLFSPFI